MPSNRRLLVPEVVQSSGMDCGPAALKAFLEGHRLKVSYGRLREACQTDVDGTSIETLEELARALGAPVEQVLLPKDLILLDAAEAVPSIAVMRLPNGNTHFAVIWRRLGGLFQVMDPASGRRWLSRGRLLHELYDHEMSVEPSEWRAWAVSDEGRRLLAARIEDLGLTASEAQALFEDAASDESFQSLAALDASVRAVAALVESGPVGRGRRAKALVESFLDTTRRDPDALPDRFWSARPGDDGSLAVRGAVVLRASTESGAASELPPAIAAARNEEPFRPARELLRWILAEGLGTPLALVGAFFAAAAAVVVEGLLFRSLLELAPLFGLTESRFGILLALFAFMIVVAGVEVASLTGELRFGRRLEARLRVAFQEKLPKLGDRYFASRLTSDMAERQHSLHTLWIAPRILAHILRYGFELLLTAVAIIWLEPGTAPVVSLVVLASIGIPLLGQRLLHERDLRVRSHIGALSRFYLDALLGLVPLRVHGAERALRTEHEALLVQWSRARLGLQKGVVALEAMQFLFGYGLIVLMLLSHLSQGGEPATVLLLVYWALNLPVLGLSIVQVAWRYPEVRNVLARATEPLQALEEMDAAPKSSSSSPAPGAPGAGMAIRLEGASVRRSGHAVLENLDLEIAPGSHVAIVGPSGAGKTSLFGLLLGWHFPSEGRVLVDGALLTGERLAEVRASTAWVDPAVQIWNQSLLDNLRYGNRNGGGAVPLGAVVERAELVSVLEMLPEGHQTRLGEGGGLVSGGEGQRVRLARAFLRAGVRLALLDEPFRGLARPQRHELLRRARALWKDATLLCITHDVSETESFDRVLVIDNGRLVEDGAPAILREDEGSRYRGLLDSERDLAGLWTDPSWRSWELEDGSLKEHAR